MNQQFVTIDNIKVPIEGERNLLEVIRKANIDLPTFCYNPELTIFGSCRMCLVEIEGRGLQPACSTPAGDGMVVHTNTAQVRNLRKIMVELMLANHDENCTVCPKSADCRLRQLASDLGVTNSRLKKVNVLYPIDDSSPSIVRDNSKCILCGQCVRVCEEIQGVGVLDFANRGAKSNIVAGLSKPMGTVECVNCGQCVKVCPVGALTRHSQINEVWKQLQDPGKTVVVQVAPAVRVALGEYFGFAPGEATIGQMVTALRMLGFNNVYDTSFGADLTVVEEGREFLKRYQEKKNLPQFTSCCPAWVKFAEQNYPDLLDNLSTCRSPQQMFGSLCKDQLPQTLDIKREDLVVVSIMPCTAKKFEALRPEMAKDGNPDVDYVLTTHELAVMIKEQGIDFKALEPGNFDLPFGFYTGAGVIFGASGGVSEAVLRYAASVLGASVDSLDVSQIHCAEGLKVTEIAVGDVKLRLAVVSGLANAKALIEKVRKGEEQFDLIEVMACCGGCINGGGQPVNTCKNVKKDRGEGLFKIDEALEFHSSEQNPYMQKFYDEVLDEHKSHELFHTTYTKREY